MKQAAISLLARAKQELATRRQSHDIHPDWPPHHLLCSCRKCASEQFAYIKEMKKENQKRKARAKARQKVSK